MWVWLSLWLWWKGERTSQIRLCPLERRMCFCSLAFMSRGLERLPALGGFLLTGPYASDPLCPLSLGGADAVQHRVGGGGRQTPCKAQGQGCIGLGGQRVGKGSLIF